MRRRNHVLAFDEVPELLLEACIGNDTSREGVLIYVGGPLQVSGVGGSLAYLIRFLTSRNHLQCRSQGDRVRVQLGKELKRLTSNNRSRKPYMAILRPNNPISLGQSVIVESVSSIWWHWTIAKFIAGVGIGAVQATLPVVSLDNSASIAN
jgi:hypothetical protein